MFTLTLLFFSMYTFKFLLHVCEEQLKFYISVNTY